VCVCVCAFTEEEGGTGDSILVYKGELLLCSTCCLIRPKRLIREIVGSIQG
jgi:hypothetical protein